MKAHFFIQLSEVIVGLGLGLLKGGMLLNFLVSRRHLKAGSTYYSREVSDREHHQNEKCTSVHIRTLRIIYTSKVGSWTLKAREEEARGGVDMALMTRVCHPHPTLCCAAGMVARQVAFSYVSCFLSPN